MIEIDSWEKHQRRTDFASRLIKLCEKQKIETCLTPLGGTGDIRFITPTLEIVLIERKSTDGDLYTSASKRLIDQCLRLIDESDWPILLIDGPMYIARGGYFRTGRYVTGWKFSSVMHMLLTLQTRGLRVLWVPRKTHTPQEVIDLYHYFQKHDHTSLLANKLKPFAISSKGLSLREQKLRVLLSLPGVGPELGNRLLEIYGSPLAVGQAPVTGLASVPGVGEKTARRIKEILSS